MKKLCREKVVSAPPGPPCGPGQTKITQVVGCGTVVDFKIRDFQFFRVKSATLESATVPQPQAALQTSQKSRTSAFTY